MVLAGSRLDGAELTAADITVDEDGAPQEWRVLVRTEDDLMRVIQLRALDSVKLIRAAHVSDQPPVGSSVFSPRTSQDGAESKAREKPYLPLAEGTLDLAVASWRPKHYWITAEGYSPLFLEYRAGGRLPSERQRKTDDTQLFLARSAFFLSKPSRFVVKGVDAAATQSVQLELEARDFAPGTERSSESAAAQTVIVRRPGMTTFGDSGEIRWHFEELPARARATLVLWDGARVLRREQVYTGGPGAAKNYAIDMSTSCGISGVSLAEDGGPKADQRIRLGGLEALGDGFSAWKHHPSNDGHLMETLTDESGRFTFDSLDPGEYGVWAVADSAEWAADTFRSVGHPVDDPKKSAWEPKPRVILGYQNAEVGFERPRRELVLREYEGH